MRLIALEQRVVERQLRAAFDIAGGKSSAVKSVIVHMTTQDGIEGYGEAVPMTAYSGQTIRGVVDALENFLFPALLEREIRSVETLHEWMAEAIKEQATAKAAIDLAYHDCVAKRLGVPVYDLLGGRCRSQVRLSWAIGLADLQEVVQEAKEMAARGFRTIKLKIGVDPDRDLAVVAAVRQALGDGIALRVDANEGYSYQVASRILPLLEQFRLQLIEQPIPRWDIQGMARLCARLDTPVLADESLYSVHDAMNLIRHQAADLFNIKLMKLGGLRPALKVAAIAEAAGLDCMVGSMPELGLATMAGAHFALAMPPVKVPCDLIGPLMCQSDVIQQDIYKHLNGELCIPARDEVGWGVEMDPGIEF